MDRSWRGTKAQVRNYLFRAWTACAVLAAYIYAWVHAPQLLTWWKRTTTRIIEDGCDLLPYPWGDRVEATIGNFGLWVQITLAIVVFRAMIWLALLAFRRIRAAHDRRPRRSLPPSAADRKSANANRRSAVASKDIAER